MTPKMDFGSAEIHLIGVNALEQKTSVGIVALAGITLQILLNRATENEKSRESINTRLPVLKKKGGEKGKKSILAI